MWRRSFIPIAAFSVIFFICSGCALSSDRHATDSPRNCVSELSFPTRNETLGSGMMFRKENNAAADRGEPTTLRTITRAAQWSDNWDRVVEVRPNITPEQLDQATGTSGICWKDIPKDSIGDDVLPEGYYLFLDGPTPKQTASWWELSNRPLDFAGAASILADAPLVKSDRCRCLRPQ
jgi:hypothetical protein